MTAVHLFLGNHSPLDPSTGEPITGKSSVVVTIPDDTPTDLILWAVTGRGGAWDVNAAAGTVPAWVACTDPAIADSIATEFGGIPVREPQVPEAAVARVVDTDPFDPAEWAR